MLNLATNFVVKMRTASGGRGSQRNPCACYFATAQSLGILTLQSVQIALVGRECKYKFKVLVTLGEFL